MLRKTIVPKLVAGIALVAASTTAVADNDGYIKYEVTITNITRGQTFTPQLVVTHNRRVQLFKVGTPASEELEILAEDGNTGPLTEVLLADQRNVSDAQTIDGLLAPGQSSTMIVEASRRHQFLSTAAMLIPTNDTFYAADTVRLPRYSATYTVPAYDAGTEVNDQNCANIPGPRCGGEGFSPDRPEEGTEGYVYIGNGFHELGRADADDNEILGPLVYDWRNPVAQITVKRLNR